MLPTGGTNKHRAISLNIKPDDFAVRALNSERNRRFLHGPDCPPCYPGAQRSQMLKALGYREHIQRKARAGQTLSKCQKRRNKSIAKTRARVVPPFAQMRHMGGKLIRTIGQARSTVVMTMMANCYNLQRLDKFLDDGVDAFYKACPSKSEVRLQGVNG